MKRWGALALAAAVALAHTGDKKLPPSSAAADLKRARQLQKEGKTAEFEKLMLACKRTLVKEKRYSCCIRGGCNQCAFEQECACGANLASKNGKGVCRECYDGWHAGHGIYDVPVEEVQVSEMRHDPSVGMSPEVATAGVWLSGTAQSPRATPMFMTHKELGRDWMFMTMAQGHALYTAQSGPRGRSKFFAPNWFMPMFSRRLGPGQFTTRTMFSFEPATVTGRYYPLLFQTGETAFGNPIVDGQHPHSFFMELGAAYTIPLGERSSVFFYGGPRGEPAIGPSSYPHRMSQSENPIAVLAHHYQDSTHIANNVVTMGVTRGRFTVEGSGFNGREPGEKRWQLEKGKIDSFSGRFTFTPSDRWALQFSGASLTSPEELHPDENAVRLTASAQYTRPLSRGHWASTILWGRNQAHDIFNSFVGETTVKRGNHWMWGRLEYTDKDATLVGIPEERRFGGVTILTAGYSYELPRLVPWVSTAVGGQGMFFFPTESFRPYYGRAPVGAQVFLRVRVVPSEN